MNILYIIGNGFDLSLGLKTGYKDFYDYYQTICSDKKGVNSLKRNISSNYKNWSDLEIALGNYTSEIKSTEEFDEIFEDIGDELAIYLKNQEDEFDITKINKNKFFENLVRPELYLPIADKNKLVAYKNKYLSNTWYLDVVTFNYTTIIDRIIDQQKNIKVGFHMNSLNSVILRGIDHIHGYVDNRMILGVNDVSQLKNRSFHNNVDILEAIIKDRCNKAYKHNLEIQFLAKIKQANLICIFGSSIGDTDNIWWEAIGEKLKQKIPMIIFTKGEEVISPRIGYKNNRTSRKMKEYFLNKTKLLPEIREEIKDNIFVALDSLMFKNIYNQILRV